MPSFVLIHGTFRRGASVSMWNAVRAGIVRACEQNGNAPRFQTIEWSGCLSFRHRVDAAEKLAEAIGNLRRELPNDPIILVGHSHGGSAIAYFLNRYPEAKHVRGCAFLSTPFIGFRVREHSAAIVGLLIWFTLASVLMVAPFMFGGIALLASCMVTSIGAVCAFWYFATGDFASNATRRFRDEDQTMSLPDGKYLFMRSMGDEARDFLVTLQFLSAVGSRAALAAGFRTAELAERHALLFWSSLVLVTYGLPVAAVIDHDFREIGFFEVFKASKSWGLVLLVVYVFSWVFYLGALVLLASLVAQAAMTAFFGWMSLWYGLFIDFAAEPVPCGKHEIVNVSWGAGGDHWLEHSATYRSEAAIKVIERWVQSLEMGGR
jgi:pimeloyl-ACP methyl ester carboxylesterase